MQVSEMVLRNSANGIALEIGSCQIFAAGLGASRGLKASKVIRTHQMAEFVITTNDVRHF